MFCIFAAINEINDENEINENSKSSLRVLKVQVNNRLWCTQTRIKRVMEEEMLTLLLKENQNDLRTP